MTADEFRSEDSKAKRAIVRRLIEDTMAQGRVKTIISFAVMCDIPPPNLYAMMEDPPRRRWSDLYWSQVCTACGIGPEAAARQLAAELNGAAT